MHVSTIAKSIWLPFGFWLAAVLSVTFGAHQPGVVCMTPVAWLLAVWIGLRCAAYTSAAQKSRRLMEAALAGGLFGLMQGILFTVIIPVMGEIKPEERGKTVLLVLIVNLLGAVICGLLSVAGAAGQERRRSSQRIA